MTHVRRNPVGWLFAAPALAMLIIFLVYPTLWTIRLSFFGGPGFVPTRFVGLDNYISLFTEDTSFFDASNFPPTGVVINNIIWLFVFVPLTVGLGLAIAVLADKVRYESLIKSIVFLPYGISATAAGIIWLFVYSPNASIGLLNALMGALIPSWQSVSFVGDVSLTTLSIIIAAVWVETGFATVILSAALKGISAEIIEAARVDGASALDTFVRIQVPMVSPTLSVVVVTMIIFVIKIFDLILIMGGPTGGPLGSARVIAFSQYIETFSNGRGGYGSAIAVVMLLLVLPVMILNVRRFRREETYR
jgi:alpha-glucoside transport system permease protein